MRFLLFFFFSQQILAAPQLFIKYSDYYDKLCSKNFEYSRIDEKSDCPLLKKSWVEEAIKKTPEFQKVWNEKSPELFKKLTEDFKFDFSRKEYSVVLSTCELGSNMSEPLVINIRKYLNAYKPKQATKDMDQFVDALFHELLHLSLSENFHKKSVILEKYKNLDQRILMHIHLYALQSYIYEKTNNEKLWKIIRQFYFEENGTNKKAIELMEKEGRTAVLKEITDSFDKNTASP